MSSVQGKRSNQLCAICEKHSSTRRGEHVLPSWLLQDLFPASEGPFTTHINGTPVPNRYGEPRQSDHLKRILLPMCNRETGGRCNGTLDTRFETNVARAAVRAMFGGRDLTSPEAHAAGIW